MNNVSRSFQTQAVSALPSQFQDGAVKRPVAENRESRVLNSLYLCIQVVTCIVFLPVPFHTSTLCPALHKIMIQTVLG